MRYAASSTRDATVICTAFDGLRLLPKSGGVEETPQLFKSEICFQKVWFLPPLPPLRGRSQDHRKIFFVGCTGSASPQHK